MSTLLCYTMIPIISFLVCLSSLANYTSSSNHQAPKFYFCCFFNCFLNPRPLGTLSSADLKHLSYTFYYTLHTNPFHSHLLICSHHCNGNTLRTRIWLSFVSPVSNWRMSKTFDEWMYHIGDYNKVIKDDDLVDEKIFKDHYVQGGQDRNKYLVLCKSMMIIALVSNWSLYE